MTEVYKWEERLEQERKERDRFFCGTLVVSDPNGGKTGIQGA